MAPRFYTVSWVFRAIRNYRDRVGSWWRNDMLRGDHLPPFPRPLSGGSLYPALELRASINLGVPTRFNTRLMS